MENQDDLTMDQKMDILGVPHDKRDSFTKVSIDFMYEKHTKSKVGREIIVLTLLNDLLGRMNYPRIEQLNHFKVIIADAKKVDVKQYIRDNMAAIIGDLELDLDKDLQFKKADKMQKYLLVVLEKLIENTNYKVVSAITQKKVSNINKTVRIYRIVDI